MANLPVNFQVKVDASGPIELFNNRLPRGLGDALKRGAGGAAYELQELARSELDRLIYSTPESPTYQRTWTLWRSTYASRPGSNHSNDHQAAEAGVDLAVRSKAEAAGGLVRLKGYEAEIEVGSWAEYSLHVHEGHGLGHRIPKPFMVKAMENGTRIAQDEIGSAIAAYIATTVR